VDFEYAMCVCLSIPRTNEYVLQQNAYSGHIKETQGKQIDYNMNSIGVLVLKVYFV